MEHELKCNPEYFSRIAMRQKTFEIRKNDRDYQVGDTLILREYDPKTGRVLYGVDDMLVAKVVYITSYEQKDGYVVMGIEVQNDQ